MNTETEKTNVYCYGTLEVNGDGYLDFKTDLERIRDLPDFTELEYHDEGSWSVGYLWYDVDKKSYCILHSPDVDGSGTQVDFNSKYRMKLSMRCMISAHREDCRARDRIAYLNDKKLRYGRAVDGFDHDLDAD